MFSYQLIKKGLTYYVVLRSDDISSVRLAASSVRRLIAKNGGGIVASNKRSPAKVDSVYKLQCCLGKTDKIKLLVLDRLRQEPDCEELPELYYPVEQVTVLPPHLKYY